MSKIIPLIIKILTALPWPIIISYITKTFKRDKRDKAPWMKIARAELGIHEEPGPTNNPRIIEYHKKTSLKSNADKVPWCSAFVCWVLEEAGMGSTRSARARSWLGYGKPSKAIPSNVVILWRTSRISNNGHVGFYIGEDPNKKDHILILGGNQSNTVSIASYPIHRVLGYRQP